MVLVLFSSPQATVAGRGAHAAMPHQGADPIVAACAAVTQLQSLVSRETAPQDSAVVSVTMLHGGEATNVIPERATLGGTIRAVDADHMARLRLRVQSVLTAVTALHGCTTEVAFSPDPYPPTVNDAQLVDAFVARAAGEAAAGGAGVTRVDAPCMAAEDFAFYGAAGVPSAFLWLGNDDGTGGTAAGLHHPRFAVDEGVLARGAALHAHLALSSLAEM